MNHSLKRRRQALNQTHHHYYLNISVEAANLSDWRIESKKIDSVARIESKVFCPNWNALFEGWTKLCNSGRSPDKQINCRWHNTVCQRGINQNYNQCHKILGKATLWHEEHGHTFSIYYCLLSFWLTLPRGVLYTSRCCLSRPCMVFRECVQLALFLAFSFSRQHPCFLMVWP